MTETPTIKIDSTLDDSSFDKALESLRQAFKVVVTGLTKAEARDAENSAETFYTVRREIRKSKAFQLVKRGVKLAEWIRSWV